MIDRRSFLRHLLALPIAAQLDVEKLLWVPKPIVVVPGGISQAALNEITFRILMPGIVDSFFKASPFLSVLQSKEQIRFHGVEIVESLWYPQDPS